MKPTAPLRDCLEMLIPRMPWDRHQWSEPDGPRVLLLHGLWRGWRAMEPMARALRRAGFSTLNLSYPSTRHSIPELVDHISRRLETHSNGQPIHAVTHSLGGIIARTALAKSQWNLRRLVMLAPPSSGSEIVDHLQNHPFLHRLLGPAGRSLGTQDYPSKLPQIPPHAEVATIMGCRNSTSCFNRLFDGPNDGIVSVQGGHIPGLKAFTVIDADHTFIPANPEAQKRCIEFLETGAWND